MRTFWIVGKSIDSKDWSFEGIYDTQTRAQLECLDKNWFIYKVEFDATDPNCWYPLAVVTPSKKAKAASE